MTAPPKIRIVFHDRERLIEKVRKEHRSVNMIAQLEEDEDGQLVVVLNAEATTSSSSSGVRSKKSFVDFKGGSDEFNNFISVLHQYLIGIVQSDSSSNRIVKLSHVKKHFYEMNPPYAPKDIILAFSHLVKNGTVTPVGRRRMQYKLLG